MLNPPTRPTRYNTHSPFSEGFLFVRFVEYAVRGGRRDLPLSPVSRKKPAMRSNTVSDQILKKHIDAIKPATPATAHTIL